MKKIYTLLLMLLMLPAAAMAQSTYPFWVAAYNGAIEIFSDAAMTNLIVADYGSEDGIDADISETAFPDGLYIKLTPDEGYIIGSLDFGGTDYVDRVKNNTCHVAVDELIDPEDGVYIMAFFEEPRTITLLSSGPGSIKAFKDIDLQNEVESGGQISDSNIFYGIYIQVTPNSNCTLESLIVNGADVTEDMIDDIYIIFELYEDITVSATFSESSAGINDINADSQNAPIETYDLNGRRINNENAPAGFRIIRQGNKISKTFIK